MTETTIRTSLMALADLFDTPQRLDGPDAWRCQAGDHPEEWTELTVGCPESLMPRALFGIAIPLIAVMMCWPCVPIPLVKPPWANFVGRGPDSSTSLSRQWSPMCEDAPPLAAGERLVIAALYMRLTSKDVLHPAQHNAGDMNAQVEVSHISVSHHLSHNPSHQEAS